MLGKDAIYVSQRFLAEVQAVRGYHEYVYPVEMQQYEEPYVTFQRRFITKNFKGYDKNF